ncbi:MAG: DUF2339 domain-containing protein [Alphaproteobacteria bacterium]|nr:DUF2339 domain-containing protein [Alphaproteobacteria bacterium]
MDNLFTLGILVVGFLGLIVPGLAVSAFVSAARRKAELESLRLRVMSLETALAGGPTTRPGPGPAAETGSDAAARSAAVAAAVETPNPAAADAATAPQAAGQQAAGKPAAGSAAGGSGLDRFERQVTSRWFVWLGAATLGLAGVFLVKEAAERGWLGPGVRVSLGFLTGLALVAAGEWVRRRFPSLGERGRADYVPPALSSGGFLFCYASLYAAGQLFGFLTPTLTFAGMAGVVFAAGLMAMLHGPFLALLSAAGGFVLPALIATKEPNGWVLFFYLAAVAWGCLEIARRRPWPWLGWIALAGCVAWSLIWIDMPRSIAPTEPLGAFLVALAIGFVGGAIRIDAASPPADATARRDWRDPRLPATIGGIAVALLSFGLARIDDYAVTGIGTLAVVGAALVFHARRHPRLDGLAIVAAAMTVAALALWHLPSILKSYAPIVVERSAAGLGWAPHLPPEATSFLGACIAFGAAYAIAAFVALWGARRPALWACVSTATPLLLLIAAYWRIARFEIDLHWAAGALCASLAFLLAATRVAPYRDAPGMGNALGIYAGAVTAAISLALAMALRDAWLSVALALELPALAWIHRRLPLESLRVIAGIVAVILCGRLALNPDVFNYVHATTIADHWPIYGYGIPLVATYLAWRDFAREPPDWLDAWLRALCFGFAALLVAFELRATLQRADAATGMAVNHEVMGIIGWLALATGLHAPVGRGERLVRWVRRCLLVFGAIAIAVFPLALDNPVWRHLSVGPWPIVNALLLAYLAPAGLLLASAYYMRATDRRGLLFAAAGLGLLLGFAWVTLETRHAFRGTDLASGSMSDAESYAYSAMWLVYAGVLLAGGLWSKSQALRIGSLVVVMAAVLKVFLADMDALTGLWRVASFFGLGLALVAIGFLYQRLVFVRGAAVASPPSDRRSPA